MVDQQPPAVTLPSLVPAPEASAAPIRRLQPSLLRLGRQSRRDAAEPPTPRPTRWHNSTRVGHGTRPEARALYRVLAIGAPLWRRRAPGEPDGYPDRVDLPLAADTVGEFRGLAAPDVLPCHLRGRAAPGTPTTHHTPRDPSPEFANGVAAGRWVSCPGCGWWQWWVQEW